MGIELAVRRDRARPDPRVSMSALPRSSETNFEEVNAAHVDRH